jgi:hypothetical protein
MKPVFPIPFLSLLLVLLPLVSQVARADTQYASTPYPPGCATQLPEVLQPPRQNAALVWSGLVTLQASVFGNATQPGVSSGQMHTDVYRVGCAEPGRSVILVEFRLPDDWETRKHGRFFLPQMRGVTGMHSIPVELKPEPNARGQGLQQHLLTRTVIGDFTNGWDNPRRFRWRYVLDVSPFGEGWEATQYYNGSFDLEFDAGDGIPSTAIAIPPTSDVLQLSPSLPLNGRLSGTWVEPGAADQGFLLTFGQPVPPAGTTVESPEDSELHVFLSWFTFDAQGEPLWLVGDGRFPQGADAVSLALWQVSAAQFMGGWVETGLGDEPFILDGKLHLRATSCNALDVSYELESLSLGTGDMTLERLFAQETAGYPCRDQLARRESLAQSPAR